MSTTTRRRVRTPGNAMPVVVFRRGKERLVERLDAVLGPVMTKLALGMFQGGKYEWMRHLPRLPGRMVGWEKPRPWPERHLRPPPQLLSRAATVRNPEAEARAYAERPLHNFNLTHVESGMWALHRSWSWLLATFPRLIGAVRAMREASERQAAPERAEADPAELARMIRAEARRLGISDVGFAKADAMYTFAENEDPGDANIVVCLLEQDWKATQSAPSAKAERAAFRAYGELFPRVAQLVEYIKGLGFDARPNDWASLEALAIHYGEQAGLGQLGLNGQLLTPVAGSRVRLGLITTDAPFALGQPVDYGIPSICDECQLCVKRCPPGAIPKQRKEKRGVVKAAIKPERCFPTMAQTHGCAVCMKVCPIQRYGLEAVTSHFVATGDILGRGTKALETYVWPLDGRAYGPGEKPRITAELINPPGWPFDKNRVEPITTTQVDASTLTTEVP